MDTSELFSLSGKVALVTPTRAGLGQAIAVGLASAGAEVVLHGHHDDLDDTEALVAAAGGTSSRWIADLSRPQDLGGLVADLLARTRASGPAGRRPVHQDPAAGQVGDPPAGRAAGGPTSASVSSRSSWWPCSTTSAPVTRARPRWPARARLGSPVSRATFPDRENSSEVSMSARPGPTPVREPAGSGFGAGTAAPMARRRRSSTVPLRAKAKIKIAPLTMLSRNTETCASVSNCWMRNSTAPPRAPPADRRDRPPGRRRRVDGGDRADRAAGPTVPSPAWIGPAGGVPARRAARPSVVTSRTRAT